MTAPAWLGALALAGPAAAGVAVSTVQLPGDRTLASVLAADADGDGLDDLVLVVARNAPVELVVELPNLGRRGC